VVVYAYALSLAERGGAPPPGPAPADDGMLRATKAALEDALTAVGFLQSGDRHAVGDLAATLTRARLTKKEASLWLAALKVGAKRTSSS